MEKRPNILLKSCGIHTARFLNYVWPLSKIMNERVKPIDLPKIVTQ